MGQAVTTGSIALDRRRASATPLPPRQSQSFQDLLGGYLATIGETGTGMVYVQGANGQHYSADTGAERSLDVGVVAAVNPNSNIGSTPARATTATPGPRSSRRCRARSGTPRTTARR